MSRFIPKILSKYIAKHFFYRFLILTIGILSLVYVITFSEMMRKIDDTTQLSFGDILYLSFSQLPPIIDKIFPFLILLSSLWSIFGLLKTSELIILKVSSVSLWKISKIYFLSAFGIAVMYVFLIMPTLASMHHSYREWENNQIQTINHIQKKIIDPTSKSVIFLTAQEMSLHLNTLKNIHLSFIDQNHLLQKVYFAPHAVYDPAQKIITFDTLKALQTDAATIEPEQKLLQFSLRVNLNNVHDSNPQKQAVTSVYDYPHLIEAQAEQKLSTNNLYILFYSLLFLPLTCAIYSFISIASVPNLYRGIKGIRNIFIALSTGLLFYVLDNWIIAVAGSGILPLFIAILTIKIPVILMCIITIFNKEYGFGKKKSLE